MKYKSDEDSIKYCICTYWCAGHEEHSVMLCAIRIIIARLPFPYKITAAAKAKPTCFSSEIQD